jgi:hypothetical protein
MSAKACCAILAVACLTASIAILDSPKAFACSCATPSPSKEFELSDAVFAGTVASIQQDNYFNSVHFDAERAWKGISDNTVTVTTASMGDSCGYDFEQGKEYLVYAYGEPLKTSLCSRTQPVADAYIDLATLGQGYVPAQDQPAPPVVNEPVMNAGIALLVSAAGAAAVLAAVAVRRKTKEKGS